LWQRESKVAKLAAIVGSIDHSPSQINFIFIVLFKSNLDHGPIVWRIDGGEQGLVENDKTTERRHYEGRCQDG
jgi:hypothetical protein